MLIDKFGKFKSYKSLLHPLAYNTQTLAIAKQAHYNYTHEPQVHSNPSLSYDSLCRIDTHKWLNSCQCTLLVADFDRLADIANEVMSNAINVKDDVNLNSFKPLVAIDTETTCLNKTILRQGGSNIGFNKLVGLCVATSSKKGYYIPVLHNETDNYPNYSVQEVKDFIQTLVNHCHLIFHNAVFDLEVLAQFGVKLNNVSFTDTLILAQLKGLKETFRSLSLKNLSKELLGRQMLSISDTLGGDDISMQNHPASNVYVYGCSDAMNTFALFQLFVKKDNPYKTQAQVTKLDHHSVNTLRSMYRVGMPIDYELALATLKTMIRRSLILEARFSQALSDKSVDIGSAEQIGTHIYSLLKSAYEKEFNNGKEIHISEPAFKVLVDKLNRDFELNVKIKQLKGDITRVVGNSPSKTLDNIYKSLESWNFISEEVFNEIYLICEILDIYRSLLHEMAIVFKMIRYTYNDDLNIARCGIGIRLNGADTSRFSNVNGNEGSFDNILITNFKSVPKIHRGDGITGFNSQGVSRNVSVSIKARRIVNKDCLDTEFLDASQTLDSMVENRLQTLFLTNKI